MIRSDIDKTCVARHLINTVGVCSQNRRVGKIMIIDLVRFALLQLLFFRLAAASN